MFSGLDAFVSGWRNTWCRGRPQRVGQCGCTRLGALSPLPQARGGIVNAPYINGEFYVIGGETVNGAGATADKVYKRVDIYNPSTNSWRRGADMLTGKHGIYPIEHAGKIYVPGGGIKSGKSESAILEIYHPAPPSGLAPLSLSMPLVARQHAHRAVDAYLWGLLPDNDRVIQRWGRDFAVTTSHPLGLLAHVGHDLPGAMRIVDPDAAGLGPATTVEWLTPDEVGDLLAEVRTDHTAWLGADRSGRWSLAGAQPKTALLCGDDGRWGRPRGRAATNRILKPAITGTICASLLAASSWILTASLRPCAISITSPSAACSRRSASRTAMRAARFTAPPPPPAPPMRRGRPRG